MAAELAREITNAVKLRSDIRIGCVSIEESDSLGRTQISRCPMPSSTDAPAQFTRLIDIMARLRAPDGCPWDREQTIDTLKKYVLEETYEVVDAIDRHDHDGLREELGDFMLQAVFLAQLEQEEGRFGIEDSVRAIADKLVRRHPH